MTCRRMKKPEPRQPLEVGDGAEEVAVEDFAGAVAGEREAAPVSEDVAAGEVVSAGEDDSEDGEQTMNPTLNSIARRRRHRRL